MPELTYTSNRSVSGVLLSRNPSDIWNLTFCSWCWCSAYWIWRRQSRPSFHACPKPRKREHKLLLIRHSAICISHGFVLVEVEGWKSTSSCQHLPNITLSWQVSLQSFPNYISRILHFQSQVRLIPLKNKSIQPLKELEGTRIIPKRDVQLSNLKTKIMFR